MRDVKRIPIILEKIKEVWLKNPDLRLTQLIGNCFGAGDLYYVEDDLLLKKLNDVYRTKEN